MMGECSVVRNMSSPNCQGLSCYWSACMGNVVIGLTYDRQCETQVPIKRSSANSHLWQVKARAIPRLSQTLQLVLQSCHVETKKKVVLAPLLIPQIQARCDWRLSINKGNGEMSELLYRSWKNNRIIKHKSQMLQHPTKFCCSSIFFVNEMCAPPDQCKLNENQKKKYLKQLLRVKAATI